MDSDGKYLFQGFGYRKKGGYYHSNTSVSIEKDKQALSFSFLGSPFQWVRFGL